MADINFKNLEFKKVDIPKFFEWNGKRIEIARYIPVEDRYDIVMITLQKSFEDGIYNPIKLDIYYHLNLVYMFTNIIFDDEDREDELKLYDTLVSSGFMEKFLSNINSNLYEEMQEDIENIAQLKTDYSKSTAGIIGKIINDLPANAEAMKEIIDNFDPEKYQAVVDFAKAANGNRNI